MSLHFLSFQHGFWELLRLGNAKKTQLGTSTGYQLFTKCFLGITIVCCWSSVDNSIIYYTGMFRRGVSKKERNKPVKKDVSDSDKYADLLVFGYACKLFRDDERALYHELGKHLIPWMGDKSIMIDRSVEQTFG